jgi:hypothetical protein
VSGAKPHPNEDFLFASIWQSSRHGWWMEPAETVALTFLLSKLRPQIAIEIGTQFGGSLEVLSKYCDHVYSIDIDPAVPDRLRAKFPNVEFIVGPSEQELPKLLAKLEGQPLGFALVDGDHSRAGVRGDLAQLIGFKPCTPYYILAHDSFNPDCRQGMREVDWSASPYVHAVELDFVPGRALLESVSDASMWGGLALAVLLPAKRTVKLDITARSEPTVRRLVAASKSPGISHKRWRHKAKAKVKGAAVWLTRWRRFGPGPASWMQRR